MQGDGFHQFLLPDRMIDFILERSWMGLVSKVRISSVLTSQLVPTKDMNLEELHQMNGQNGRDIGNGAWPSRL